MALNGGQANRGCFSPISTAQMLATPPVNVANHGWKFFLGVSLQFGLKLHSESKHSDA